MTGINPDIASTSEQEILQMQKDAKHLARKVS